MATAKPFPQPAPRLVHSSLPFAMNGTRASLSRFFRNSFLTTDSVLAGQASICFTGRGCCRIHGSRTLQFATCEGDLPESGRHRRTQGKMVTKGDLFQGELLLSVASCIPVPRSAGVRGSSS
jgi:hypothetical protein